jgi:hypothetical protein
VGCGLGKGLVAVHRRAQRRRSAHECPHCQDNPPEGPAAPSRTCYARWRLPRRPPPWLQANRASGGENRGPGLASASYAPLASARAISCSSYLLELARRRGPRRPNASSRGVVWLSVVVRAGALVLTGSLVCKTQPRPTPRPREHHTTRPRRPCQPTSVAPPHPLPPHTRLSLVRWYARLADESLRCQALAARASTTVNEDLSVGLSLYAYTSSSRRWRA